MPGKKTLNDFLLKRRLIVPLANELSLNHLQNMPCIPLTGCRTRLIPGKNFRCSVRHNLFVLLILCFITSSSGCSSDREQLAGSYNAVITNASSQVSATLELTADGKGFWSIDTDNAPFRWDIHQGKLRLHTRAGGVIEGTFTRDSILISLPGTGNIHFQRAR